MSKLFIDLYFLLDSNLGFFWLSVNKQDVKLILIYVNFLLFGEILFFAQKQKTFNFMWLLIENSYNPNRLLYRPGS